MSYSFIYENQQPIILITSADFQKSGTSLQFTCTISESGSYRLSELITATIQNPSQAIIYIDSDDVNLNLNGQTLALNSESTGIDGIKIANNRENITIKNGLIRGAIQNGISIGSNCSNIIIEEVNIKDCDGAGIAINGTNGNFSKNIKIDTCNIRNSDGGGTADAIGIKLEYCQFIQIINSQFILNSNINTDYAGYGVYALNSAGCGFDNCIVSGNSGNAIGAGFYVTNCNGFIFNNCLAGLNVGINTSSESYGFYFNNSHYNQIHNCTANNNKAAHTAAGFALINSNGNKLTDCVSNSTQITGSGSTDAAYGFLLTATQHNNELINCTAFGIMSGTHSSSKGVGFSLDNTRRCILFDCSANSNGGNVGYGIGIHLQSTCELCTVKNCEMNLNTSSTAGQGYGFKDDSSNNNNLIIESFAYGNRDTTGSPTDNNYDTNYSLTNVITEVALTTLGSIPIDTKKNISITPYNGIL